MRRRHWSRTSLTGVLVGFLAEVFSRGARLREDVEGLVQVPAEDAHRVVCHLDDLLERPV